MEQYLLDTHTLLWMQDDNASLSAKAKTILSDKHSQLYLSIASFWEITIKLSLGKLELNYTIHDLEDACNETKITILPIEISFLQQLQSLPFIHKDPFDRIIAATAIELNLKIITLDNYIKQYKLETVW
jgi:PIN domain nuclease of toxin-antitoxin system